jgi:hypothetical protein
MRKSSETLNYEHVQAMNQDLEAREKEFANQKQLQANVLTDIEDRQKQL